jgi:hypothetical protein
MEASWREHGNERRFVLASAVRPEDARRSAAELPVPIDLVVTSPTELAQQAAAKAVGDRWVFTSRSRCSPRALRVNRAGTWLRVSRRHSAA